MSIKEEFKKMEKEQKRESQKNIGNGMIKVEIKDGQIQASSQLHMPGKTLIMTLVILEALQRSIVENDKRVNTVFKKLRDLSDEEIIGIIKDHSFVVKDDNYESDKTE